MPKTGSEDGFTGRVEVPIKSSFDPEKEMVSYEATYVRVRLKPTWDDDLLGSGEVEPKYRMMPTEGSPPWSVIAPENIQRYFGHLPSLETGSES